MEYISIKNGSEQFTNIHMNVFSDIVKLLPLKINGIKIKDEPIINIVKNNNNVDIFFDFTISEESDIFEIINTAKKIMIDIIFNLVDFKPHNILMNYKGRH